MKKYVLLLGAAIGLASCGVYTNYIGKTYPATLSPEVFVDWKDVPCDYETMGHIEATPRMFKTVEDAQAAIERKARETGADAVVFTGIYDEVSNPTVTATEKTEHDVFGDKTKTYTETRSANVTHNLTATFIKYKR